MKEDNRIAVYGLHGSSHKSPKDTKVSYWAALGAGADGIVAALQITKDGTIVCCPDSQLSAHGGSIFNVNDEDLKDLKYFDAGAAFHSVPLDNNNQSLDKKGKYHPWAGREISEQELTPPEGSKPVKRALRYPLVSDMLREFGRRSGIFLLIASDDNGPLIAEKALEELKTLGLSRKVTVIASAEVCGIVKGISPVTPVACIADPARKYEENTASASKLDPQYLLVNLEDLTEENGFTGKSTIPLLVTSGKNKYAPSPEEFEKILGWENVAGICFRAVEECVDLVTPPALIISDDLKTGTEKYPVDPDIWSCGYSHISDYVQLLQDKGFVISLPAGGPYAGGAALTLLPIYGRFDARVDFEVSDPQQGTTLEMAAISQDPGYYRADKNKLRSKDLNLTFDVHGAPPYASSERDETDGFRIGWNNGFNLTRIDPDWSASSSNMYNRYGRNVGSGAKDNPRGTLRLVRTGSVFNSYYRDAYNKEWVCSGSALVPNLAEDVHIRLAAKHWPKGGMETAPGNKIVFTNFKLYQF